MARLRYNGLTATLGDDLLLADTTITFASALQHAAGAVPTITGTDYIPLFVLADDGTVLEIMHLTAYTSGATTGTVDRAQEDTTATDHGEGLRVVHGLTVADADGFSGSGGSGGGITQLAEVSLASAAASISFTGTDIPGSGYRDLKLVLQGRSSQAGSESTVLCSLNGDTTDANYRSQYHLAQTTVEAAAGGADRLLGLIPAATATAGGPGVLEVDLHEYAGTTFHKALLGQGYNVGSNPYIYTTGLTWRNAAAVTSITLTLSGGYNFIAGSTARLYGRA